MIFDFGKRLKELRQKSKLTQQQVAKKLQTTKSSISSYENNINTPPLNVVKQLSYLYGVTTDYLLGVEPKRHLLIDGITPAQEQALLFLAEEFRRLNQANQIDPPN